MGSYSNRMKLHASGARPNLSGTQQCTQTMQSLKLILHLWKTVLQRWSTICRRSKWMTMPKWDCVKKSLPLQRKKRRHTSANTAWMAWRGRCPGTCQGASSPLSSSCTRPSSSSCTQPPLQYFVFFHLRLLSSNVVLCAGLWWLPESCRLKETMKE